MRWHNSPAKVVIFKERAAFVIRTEPNKEGILPHQLFFWKKKKKSPREPYSRACMMVNILACSISGWWISVSHQFAMASLLSLVIIDLLLLMWIFRRDGPSQEPVRDWLWSGLSLNTLARRLSVSSDWGFLSLKVLKLALRKACKVQRSAGVQQDWVWRALFFHMEYKACVVYSLVSFVL